MFLRFQRSIACAIFSRLSVGICIDTEHGEVTGMTGPHPVICFSAKLTDRRRRSCHHTHIRVYFLIEHIEFISGIEWECLWHDSFLVFQITFCIQLFCQFLEKRTAEWFSLSDFFSSNLSIDNISDIFDTFDKCKFQSRSRKFHLSGSSPETIRQIIVFNAAMLLDGSISAMVIGQDQSFRWDNLSGTASSEDTDSVF